MQVEGIQMVTHRGVLPSLSSARGGWMFVTAALLTLHATAFGQLFERATVLENARIVTQAGPVVEKGSIVIKGGRIVELGAEVSVPMLAKKIDAGGKTITPGLIDVWSGLGHAGASSSSDPTARASDAVSTYDHEAFRDALRSGVMTFYVGTHGGSGVNGIGAVVQLAASESGPVARVLDDDAFLCVNLGTSDSVVGRLKTFVEVRKAFIKAIEYRRALEDYDEELKEYLEALEKRREEKEKAADESGDAKKDGEASDADEKKKGESDESPADGEDKDKEKEEKDKPKPDPKPDPNPNPNPNPDPKPELPPDDGSVKSWFSRGFADGEGDGDGDGDSPANESKSDDKKDGKKGGKKGDGDDELKKPEKPAPDRQSNVLLRAIDHELTVRIRAERSASILNALELAEEFKIDIVIEGATEAYLVADELAEKKVPVVLGRLPRSELFQNGAYRRHSMRNAAALTGAGVPWSIGSGGSASSSRFVGLNAQLAVGYGATEGADNGSGDASFGDWLSLVTTRASEVIGLGRRGGRLASGAPADLVIWSGDPSDPGSRVEQVMINGKVAYDVTTEGNR